jgi:hypothetical protein
MNTIHISTADGQSSQYDEGQIRAMLQQGLLREDTLFWKEGMTDWQPLRNLFPAAITVQPGPPPIPHVAAASDYTFTKNPFGLTQALKVMLWIQMGVAVISMFSDFGQMNLASSGNITPEAAEANDARQGMIGLLYLGVFIATGVIFLKWIYRANLNCRGFGAAEMKFTPGWSIGYYFIPFLNLVRPYQAMKEIWKVSSDPRNWQAQQGSGILGWWWALWLISGFLGQMVFRMSMKVDSPSSLEAVTMLSIISSLVEIPLILVAMAMITRIIEKQSKLTKING